MKRRVITLFVLAILFLSTMVLFDKGLSSRRSPDAGLASKTTSDPLRVRVRKGRPAASSGPSAEEEVGYQQQFTTRQPLKLNRPQAQASGRGRARPRKSPKRIPGLAVKSAESAPRSVRPRPSVVPEKGEKSKGGIVPGDSQDLSDARIQAPSAASPLTTEFDIGATPAPMKTPATETESDEGSPSTPTPNSSPSLRTLTPPVPVDQPPLHPLLRTTVAPEAPGMAGLQQQAVRGRLRVRLLVRANGFVGRVEVIVSSGDPALDNAAREGLLQWYFEPARKNGNPVDAYLLLWVTFQE